MIPYEELASSFQARHLAVPMELAHYVGPEMLVADAVRELTARHFDQAPVQRDDDVLGFVLLSRMRTAAAGARIGDVLQALAPGNIVSADAPIASLLTWIEGPGMLFVLDGRSLTGFITVSDFNKQPARAHLYILLATLEMGIAALIRERYPERQVELLGLLPTNSADRILQLYAADRVANVDADLVAYLTFSNLINIVGKNPALLDFLGADSPRTWKEATVALVELRNSVMHPTRSLVSGKDGLIALREREESLRGLLMRLQR